MIHIIHFSTSDNLGAGSAASRFHKNLIVNGVTSQLFVADKRTNDEYTIAIPSGKSLIHKVLNKVDSFFNFFNSHYYFFEKNRNSLSAFKKIDQHLEKKPDIIVLHWITGFVNLDVIHLLQKKYSCKVYWYLMDMAPMTGGCHYAWDCNGYQNSCNNCPAVSFPYATLPSKTLLYKKTIVKQMDIELLSASSWLNKQLNTSTIFKDSKIHSLMLGIDESIFSPLSSQNILQYKEKYKLSKNKKVIFFGATDPEEYRKGFTYLLEALKTLLMDSTFDRSTITLLTAGRAIDQNLFNNFSVEHVHLGYLSGDIALASAYQVSDIFISPSIEDSGPMMINESMMCGTPVVAFNMGVASDLIKNKKTGYLARLKDSKDLAYGIKELLSLSDTELNIVKNNCRTIAIEKTSEKIQIHNFFKLQED